jgi:RNA polymerase sigma-70 factor (ECF subfamily)
MNGFLALAPTDDCLRRAAAGERDAQREVYEHCAGPVFALVRRIVRGRAAAEDVFQDCMIALLRHLPQFRGDAPFGAWVRQVALRHCLMHLRSPWQRARRALAALLPEYEDAIGAGFADPPLAELIDLERALARLPDVTRAIVWMHDGMGLSHEEIGAHFGRTPSFSKSQVSRARALLRAQLADGRTHAAGNDVAAAAAATTRATP